MYQNNDSSFNFVHVLEEFSIILLYHYMCALSRDLKKKVENIFWKILQKVLKKFKKGVDKWKILWYNMIRKQ